ncbi:MAG: NAD-dependent epimerase/dehydratase family protein [Terriglobia bacterium]
MKNDVSAQNPPQPEGRRAERFLIIGAKGFIGSWIVKNLVAQGETPCLFDSDQDQHRLRALLGEEQISRLCSCPGDITRVEELERAVADHGITQIIHLAALQVPACAANPVRGAQVNVVGTLNVFEAARRHKSQINRVVYASSAAVFGPEEFYGGSMVPGDAILHPGTHYGVFKECNEGNARVYFASDGISSVGLRPWAVYGVGRDQGLTSAPTKAIKSLVVARPYVIRFTGAFDMQYANDTARIFLRCAAADLTGARAYSLRGAVIQVEEFIDTLEKVSPGARKLVRAEGKPLPIAADLDDSALVRDVGDIPRTPLEDGIRETLETFRMLQREGRLDVSDLEEQ